MIVRPGRPHAAHCQLPAVRVALCCCGCERSGYNAHPLARLKELVQDVFTGRWPTLPSIIGGLFRSGLLHPASPNVSAPTTQYAIVRSCHSDLGQLAAAANGHQPANRRVARLVPSDRGLSWRMASAWHSVVQVEQGRIQA
jgi:hypothetical protein